MQCDKHGCRELLCGCPTVALEEITSKLTVGFTKRELDGVIQLASIVDDMEFATNEFKEDRKALNRLIKKMKIEINNKS